MFGLNPEQMNRSLFPDENQKPHGKVPDRAALVFHQNPLSFLNKVHAALL